MQDDIQSKTKKKNEKTKKTTRGKMRKKVIRIKIITDITIPHEPKKSGFFFPSLLFSVLFISLCVLYFSFFPISFLSLHLFIFSALHFFLFSPLFFQPFSFLSLLSFIFSVLFTSFLPFYSVFLAIYHIFNQNSPRDNRSLSTNGNYAKKGC